MVQRNLVGIARIEDVLDEEMIRDSIFQLLDGMKDRIQIPSDATIMIKPNICIVKCCQSGTTVDPRIVKYLVDWLFNNYEIKKIYIGEADATSLNIEVAFKVLGWEEIFNDYDNVELVNLAQDSLVKVELDGLYFKDLMMSQKFMESDLLISVAKLKTHVLTGMTGILKNEYGANPEKFKVKYHPHLDEVICDLTKARLPDLCLIDGVIAMEGEGPECGIPRPAGIVVIGDDALATDHACARLMGFNPGRISHLKLARKQNLGSFDYDTYGESIEEVKEKFQFIPFWKKFLSSIYNNKTIQNLPMWKKVVGRIFRT